MSRLDAHLGRVEEHAFQRELFPVEVSGHPVDILKNDGSNEGERVKFIVLLKCLSCGRESCFRGNIRVTDLRPIDIQLLKCYVLSPFVVDSCE